MCTKYLEMSSETRRCAYPVEWFQDSSFGSVTGRQGKTERVWRQLPPPETHALSPSCPPRLRHHHALEPLDRWLVLHWASVCLSKGPQRGNRESLGGLETHLCCLPAITAPGVQHGNHHPLPKGLLFPAVGVPSSG